MNESKCPHCGQAINALHVESVKGRMPNKAEVWCLVFSCGACRAALSAGFDEEVLHKEIFDKFDNLSKLIT